MVLYGCTPQLKPGSDSGNLTSKFRKRGKFYVIDSSDDENSGFQNVNMWIKTASLIVVFLLWIRFPKHNSISKFYVSKLIPKAPRE